MPTDTDLIPVVSLGALPLESYERGTAYRSSDAEGAAARLGLTRLGRNLHGGSAGEVFLPLPRSPCRGRDVRHPRRTGRLPIRRQALQRESRRRSRGAERRPGVRPPADKHRRRNPQVPRHFQRLGCGRMRVSGQWQVRGREPCGLQVHRSPRRQRRLLGRRTRRPEVAPRRQPGVVLPAHRPAKLDRVFGPAARVRAASYFKH